MNEENQVMMKQYPIFKIKFPETCETNPGSCSISDIKMDMIGTKELKESYIVKYQCSAKAFLINALVKANIAPTCEEIKFPLDAFLVSKSGMGDNISIYEDEEMPATDYCSLKDQTGEYSTKTCGSLVYGFPYTDEMNGYKLIPLTDENRAEVYAEFKEQGFLYEKSQAVMSKLVEDQSLLLKVENDIAQPSDFVINDSEITNPVAASQILFDYASSVIDAGMNMVGAVVECVMDLPQCLDMQ